MKAGKRVCALTADLGRRLNCLGGYQVDAFGAGRVTRPNRLAAGMQFTNLRRNRRAMKAGDNYSREALKLIVHGTGDKLRGLGMFHVRRGPCPCCGAKTAGLMLTDQGRVRLRAARRRAAERSAATH